MYIAINKALINKPIEDELKKYNHDFEKVDITIGELAEFVNLGYAFCPHFVNQSRKQANFERSGFLAVDIDRGLTLDEIRQDDFFKNYASLLYTTVSHTEHHHRFRVVFELEESITDSVIMKNAQIGLIKHFSSDESCKDACRLFFGSSNSNPELLGHTMPKQIVDELARLGKEACGVHHSSLDNNPESKAAIRSNITLDKNLKVKSAQGELLLLRDITSKIEIYCPKHADSRPSAFTFKSSQGSVGIFCSACARSYFLDDGQPVVSKPYYFDYHWDKVLSIGADEYHDNMDDNGNVDLEELRGVKLLNQKFLPANTTILDSKLINVISETDKLTFQAWGELYGCIEEFTPKFDMVLIKSPKGSGKTEWLKAMVDELKAEDFSVLMIGHRRTLILSTAKRLGLTPYIHSLGGDSDAVIYNNPTKYFAICVDSLPTKIDPRCHKYDIVVIDEIEQVFAHLLSGTLKKHRREALHTLQYYVQSAKSFIGLDADLNKVTIETMYEMLKAKDATTQVYLNQWKPEQGEVLIYQQKNHLIGDLYENLTQGKKCFICSNSKRLIDSLSREIQDRLPDLKVMVITSDNAQSTDIQWFIANIKENLLKYDAIFTSPTMGTGVDITFDGGQSLVDCVYGMFEARINTHFDIDQQIARVRHPKAVKVWISPETFNFETDSEVIKAELRLLDSDHRAFIGIGSDGTKLYNEDPLYDTVFSNVTSWQRGSKNDLRYHYINMKEQHGWKVTAIDSDKKLYGLGKCIIQSGVEKNIQYLCELTVTAEILTPDEYDKKINAEKAGGLKPEEIYALRRYEIESFYRHTIDTDLFMTDNSGGFRYQLRNFELLNEDLNEILKKDSYDDTNYFSDRTHRVQKQNLLKTLLTTSGIWDDGQFCTDKQITLNDLTAFTKACLDNKSALELFFDIPVRKNIVNNPVQQLGDVLKLLGLSLSKSTTRVNGKKIYRYKLNREKLTTLIDWIDHRKNTVLNDWIQSRYQDERQDIGEISVIPIKREVTRDPLAIAA